ncbi:YdcF family protein [Catenuloplanes japonicus]|uniref:YdcF family protein n=1 Tax=Catenuloplanes japonicus TaxID=33876 RepID=UPI00052489E0|nr:ElyC/SanA/YdcF family protein [Catenuloplanes japonicus]
MQLGSTTPRIVHDRELDGIPVARMLDVMRATTAVLSLPQAAADTADALIVPSGQGEEWRITHAIRLWEANPRLRLLLIANGNPAETTYDALTPDYLHGLGLRRTAGVHVQADPAPNTALQAAWIADRVAALGITSFGLVVSPYHLVRAYLTVLKALGRAGLCVPMWPVPVAISPDARVPETGATAYDLLPGEVARMVTYMDRGWIATTGELRDYVCRLWSH